MNIILNLIGNAIEMGRLWYASSAENRAKMEADLDRKNQELAAMRIQYQAEHDERTIATQAEINAAKGSEP